MDATAGYREATYAVWRAEALVHGGEVAEMDGLLLFYTGIPVQYWNGVYVTAIPPDPRQALSRIPEWFAERTLPYGVLVPVELEPEVAAAAGATGLRLAAVQRCMVATRATFTPPDVATPGLEIRRTGPADLEDFLAVQVQAFGMEPRTARDFLVPPVGQPGWTHLTSYEDGVPVVTAIGVRTGDAIGVYGVGTVGTARRRGYGAALTAQILREAFASGATFAHLNPSELGAAMYRRLGFREVGGFAIWLPRDP